MITSDDLVPGREGGAVRGPEAQADDSARIERTEAEWRARLTPQQYHVTREKGTERPFTGRYSNHHEPGIYRCVACGNQLFSSGAKYDSGTGWPSFNAPLREGAVEAHVDRGLGMTRTEIVCSRCGSHLGHVFPDGPAPTGLRYCMNSAALDFEAASREEE